MSETKYVEGAPGKGGIVDVEFPPSQGCGKYTIHRWRVDENERMLEVISITPIDDEYDNVLAFLDPRLRDANLLRGRMTRRGFHAWLKVMTDE